MNFVRYAELNRELLPYIRQMFESNMRMLVARTEHYLLRLGKGIQSCSVSELYFIIREQKSDGDWRVERDWSVCN